MTTNSELRAEICKVLLDAVGLRGRWTAMGPVQQPANEPLAPEQRTMVGIATAIWTGTSSVCIADAWNELEPERLTLVGTLLVAAAYGDDGLSDWLEIYLGDRKPAGGRPPH